MRRDPYIVNVDRGRNCYSCGSFGHLGQNCRSWEIIGQRRRMEYGNNLNMEQNNLNRKESLIVFD